MSEGQLFGIDVAKKAAQELSELIKEHCDKIGIAGSIRRENQNVHDIDIVAQEKFMQWNRICTKLKATTEITKMGNRLISGIYRGIPYDVYYANPAIYEVVLLIRTGSRTHNIKLCSKAKEKGWKLCANGDGLVDDKHYSIDNTERGIIEKLLGEYIEPKDR